MVMQEGGKAVNSFIDSLKAQPLSLALVVMNLALLALLYYVAERTSEVRKHDVELIYKQQEQVQALLARCVVPEAKP